MRITSGGLVGINAVPTDYNDYGDGLVVRKSSITGSSGITVQATANTGYSSLYFGDPDDTKVGGLEYSHSLDSLFVVSGNSTAMVLDSSQRVLINTSSVAVGSTTEAHLQVATASGIALALRSTATAVGPAAVLALGRQNGTGIVSDDDHIGDIRFASHDGTDLTHESARIRAAVDGAPGNNDVPGRLEFSTTADGAITPTERMRITSSGTVLIGGQTDYGVARTYLTQRTDDDGFGVVDANQTYTTLLYANAAGSVLKNNTNLPFSFQTSNTTAMTIDSSQRVIVGADSTRSTYNHTVANTTAVSRILGIASGGVDALHFDQARGSVASPTASNADGDGSYISFSSYDGTNWDDIGSIAVVTDAQQDSGRFIIRTTPSGGSQSERVRVDQYGNIGIGGIAPQSNGGVTARVVHAHNASGNDWSINHWTSSATGGAGGDGFIAGVIGSDVYLYNYEASDMIIATNSSTAMTIDSSQRVLIGSTTARANFWNSTVAPQFQIESASDFGRQAAIISSSTNTAYSGVLILAHQLSGSNGGNTLTSNGTAVGTLAFQGNDGTQFVPTATISSQVDGTSGTDDTPGRLVFATTVDGATSATERMRINNSGHVVIAGAAGNLNSPTTLMGDMNAYLRVGNSGAQIGSMVKYSYGPNTNVDGAVFQLRTGSNGQAAYIRITVSNYQGIFEAHYYCNNASGNWNVNQATVTDVGGANAPSLNYTSGVQNPTITVDLNNTSYSGGFLDVTASVAWQLTLA